MQLQPFILLAFTALTSAHVIYPTGTAPPTPTASTTIITVTGTGCGTAPVGTGTGWPVTGNVTVLYTPTLKARGAVYSGAAMPRWEAGLGGAVLAAAVAVVGAVV